MKKVTLLFILLLPLALNAQESFIVNSHHNIRLPHGLDNLSTIDNQLFGYSHLLVSAPINTERTPSLQPDTLFANIIPGADYVVRNPHDSTLYFTRCDADGTTNLYVLTNNRFCKVRRINIHGWQRDICHPTFSPSGKMMVFTSKGKVGLGGYDLWCSLWNGHRWTRPINLGNTVNTPGNETNPTFYQNYLIFTSDSMPHSTAGNHLYALYMHDAATIDEIIFDTYTIQPLPYPINSEHNDWNMAFYPAYAQGWWITNRSGQRELYSFKGRLDGIMVSGTIFDVHNTPIPNANIQITLNGRIVASTQSDKSGNYQMFVLPNNNYLLQASLSGYFNYEKEISIVRTTERLLINSLQNDIQLSSLPINHPIIIQDLFSHEADIEISPEGELSLKPIIIFLRDNPDYKATIDVYCDQTNNDAFNNLLIERRISTLRQYLHTYLPSDTQFSVQNGNKLEEIGSENTGANFVFVKFSK